MVPSPSSTSRTTRWAPARAATSRTLARATAWRPRAWVTPPVLAPASAPGAGPRRRPSARSATRRRRRSSAGSPAARARPGRGARRGWPRRPARAVGGEPALGLLRAREARVHEQHAAARAQVLRARARRCGRGTRARRARVPRARLAARGVAGRRRDVGRVGDDEVEAAPAPRARTGRRAAPRARGRLRRAFSRALSTARRLRSTAVARAPRRAAVSPRIPVPVQRSSTVRPGQVVPRHDPAEQGGVAGRPQDPGEDDDAHASCTSHAARSAIAAMGSVAAWTAERVSLRELFDGVTDHTVGVEEELMVLDPDTLDLLPVAARVHEELGERVSLRGELAGRPDRDRLAGVRHDRPGRGGARRVPPRARRRRRRLGAPGGLGHASVRRRPRARCATSPATTR